jgi:O-methyltransferase
MSSETLPQSDLEAARDAYLDLLQDALLGRFAPSRELVPSSGGTRARRLLGKILKARGAEIAVWETEDSEGVESGEVWPRYATTMIGRLRLNNIRSCIEDGLASSVPGDLIETGVWKGGGSIYMRGVLKAWNVTDRTVWAADSYEGLPKPEGTYSADGNAYPYYQHNDVLGVSLADVRANFARFGLLDEHVSFLKGWFKDTLPTLKDNQWSVIRLDGDLYESTMQALTYLYPNLAPGGWLIIDDYNWVPVCKQAVTDYRKENGITESIVEIDNAGVCWQRQ